MAEKRVINGIIYAISFVEITIGSGTMAGLCFSSIFHLSKKPFNVFLFVFVSAAISTLLGIGICLLKNWARRLLLFFSGWVILTKILVFLGILHFSGELVTAISNPAKNTISILYHSAVIVLLNSPAFREKFQAPPGTGEKRHAE